MTNTATYSFYVIQFLETYPNGWSDLPLGRYNKADLESARLDCGYYNSSQGETRYRIVERTEVVTTTISDAVLDISASA